MLNALRLSQEQLELGKCGSSLADTAACGSQFYFAGPVGTGGRGGSPGLCGFQKPGFAFE